MPSPYEIAITAISQNISVFPAYARDVVERRGNKDVEFSKGAPACAWKTAHSTKTERIKAWFYEKDKFNVAVPCDEHNLFVIDVDLYKDEFDPGSYAELLKEWEKASQVKQWTMRGGRHLFFRLTDHLREFSIGQDLGDSKGIDWRGKGGYIILYDNLDFSRLTDVPDSLLRAMRNAPDTRDTSPNTRAGTGSSKNSSKEFYESYKDAGLSFEVTKDKEYIYTPCPKCSHDRKKSNQDCLRIQPKKQEWKCFHCNWQGQLTPKPIFKMESDYFEKVLNKMGLEIRFNIRKQAPEFMLRINFKKDWPMFEVDYFDKWHDWHKRIASRIRENIYKDYVVINKSSGNNNYRQAKLTLEDFNMLFDSLMFEREIDPFKQYLEQLPEWDGIERLDHLLETVFEVDMEEIDERLLKWASRYTMMAIIARTYKPGVKADHLVVLHGPEGLTKSTFWKYLLPDEEVNHYYTDTFSFFLKTKEKIEATLGKIIVDVSEMSGGNRAEQESILAYITSQVDYVRLSYAHNATSIPRQFIMVGTTNKNDSLPASLDGLRRFVVVPVISMQVSYNELLDLLDQIRDQLWAEAIHVVRHKSESYAMTGDLIKLNKTQVAKYVYTIDQGTEDVLSLKHNALIELSNQEEGLTLTQVFGFCQIDSGGIAGKAGRATRTWLENHGWKKFANHPKARGRRNWKYMGEIKAEVEPTPEPTKKLVPDEELEEFNSAGEPEFDIED